MEHSEGPALFYESYLDALKEDVKAVGGSKAVGQKFWPEKNIEIARNAVNDRLNAERRDRFAEDQERWIMREAVRIRGFSAAICYLCDETDLERPRPKAREDEAARLQRQIVEATHVLKHSLDRLERLTQPPLQAISGGKP